MPGAQADHSRNPQLAPGAGKIGADADAKPIAQGRGGAAQPVAEAEEQGGSRGVRLADQAGELEIFKAELS